MTDGASGTSWPNPDLAPAATCALLDGRTRRLVDSIRDFDDSAARAPSRLPGWSRGHLLTHLARNADALTNLCTWARTGRELPMYASSDQRAADIEAGAGRSAAALLDDVESTAESFALALDAVPDERWLAEVRHGPRNAAKPAWWIPMMRLGEIELHHFDLDVGHDPDAWAPTWVRDTLPDAIGGLDDRAGEPIGVRATDTGTGTGTGTALGSTGGRTVVGTAPELLAWVTGRTDGATLRAEPSGPLPRIGAWR